MPSEHAFPDAVVAELFAERSPSAAWDAFLALLDTLPGAEASDLHMAAGRKAHWRRHGELAACNQWTWSDADMGHVAQNLLDPLRRELLESSGSADLGYSSPGGHRFRVNLFRSLGRLALVARHLPERFASLRELALPEILSDLAYLPSGLVLVTGVTGSGKSTTLATLIHEINSHCARHILTIEDPVEFVHTPLCSLISHRELGTDTPDFALAVRAALREDPDVILVGELRDAETMRTALTAAETGHLVFSTLHTADAVGAAERFIGAFPGEEQEVARHRLSLVLKAVVAQQLLPRADIPGRVPAVEILRGTPAVMNLIASGRASQIYSAMESGADLGMQTYDQSLAQLTRQKKVHHETAKLLARNPDGFEWLVKNGGQATPGGKR
ncbi:MAG: PilT/PilU family type 4a pilus ATPase [Zoogloeaceae bacterium]|nr:PilT/PilU family type 4a pilus ATPase [Zoogloeaceae bacterium]